jgi:Transglutaminase-like superfamily
MDLPDPVRHTAYSDPGRYRRLLRDVPTDLVVMCAAARNVIVHYRAQLPQFDDERLPEVNSRWVERILDRDQHRFGTPLLQERPLTDRVAGCCRDHSLLLVSMLREHGVPARTRVGFATYLLPGWALDHVIGEHHDGRRWVRTDPGVAPGALDGADPLDLGAGVDSPFRTAAEAWNGYRAGTLDVSRHAVFPGAEGDLAGVPLVRRYVLMQLAHRYGDEMLLWDSWGATAPGGEPVVDEEVDRIAHLLIAADAETDEGRVADRELFAWYTADARLHPGETIVQHSPLGPDHEIVRLR